MRGKISTEARNYTADNTETLAVEATKPSINDEGLLKKAAAGDPRAFHALVERHLDRLYRLAASLVGNASDADDVVQETLAGAYRGLSQFQGRSTVGTWLTRICVTQVAVLRRERYRKANVAAVDDQIAGRPVSGDVAMDVKNALERLSPAHREVLVLREYERMSYEEIADVLGVAQGTVESRIFRARSEMRKLLQAYLPG